MMEAYRTAARQRLRNLQVDENRCSHVEEVIELSENHTVRDLLKDVQSYGSPASTIDVRKSFFKDDVLDGRLSKILSTDL
jgi:hypothetical protein